MTGSATFTIETSTTIIIWIARTVARVAALRCCWRRAFAGVIVIITVIGTILMPTKVYAAIILIP
jgi:hypothetical protein